LLKNGSNALRDEAAGVRYQAPGFKQSDTRRLKPGTLDTLAEL
jgi:hypothetical protein